MYPARTGIETETIKNRAGGNVYAISMWDQCLRFLILGTEGGTYYASEREITDENIGNLKACIEQDGKRVVRMVRDVSYDGRAPKNTPAIFALAAAFAYGDLDTRREVANVFLDVCRIPTHIFMFLRFIKHLKGSTSGRLLRTMLSKYYLGTELGKLAYHGVKYRNRHGWTHRDVLRVAHPQTDDQARNELLKYFTGKPANFSLLPPVIADFETVQLAETFNDVKPFVMEGGLTHDMFPTHLKGDGDLWRALLPHMPMTALIRNLGNMTSKGVFDSSHAIQLAVAKLTNREQLKAARIHPINVLSALMVYKHGGGYRGKLTWNPEQAILRALNDAFYMAFELSEPTGQRVSVSIDVSGSMASSALGMEHMTSAQIAAAIAMYFYRVEPNADLYAFGGGKARGIWSRDFVLTPLELSRTASLEGVLAITDAMNFGGTDASLPIKYALQNGLEYDTFIVVTDSEHWAEDRTPAQVLREYRQLVNPGAKLIALATASNNYSIADPKDAGMLDICGFDSSVPDLINNML